MNENLIDVHYTEIDGRPVIETISMPRPSNFHAHLRSGPIMEAVALDTMRWVKYLLVMPNTGPIDTLEKVQDYHSVLQALAHRHGLSVGLVMTVYLTSSLTPDVVAQMAELPFPCAVKYYPPHKGATTGSGLGVELRDAQETLHAMEQHGVRLLGHFESVYDHHGHELPMVEREGYFMDHEFGWLRETFHQLRINIEHATTVKAINWVRYDQSGLTTCGITPQAMLFVTDDLTARSWGNHLRCMPIAKSEIDSQAVLEFATSGDFRAHLGDDTAPHLARAKEGPLDQAACGCYLPHALALYAHAFASVGALDERFVQFACFNGPASWEFALPDQTNRVTLKRDTQQDIPNPTPVPEENDVVIPLGWTMQDDRLKIGISLGEV